MPREVFGTRAVRPAGALDEVCVCVCPLGIIAFYLIKDLGDGTDDLAAVKKKILKWAKKKAKKHVNVVDLTKSFADGKAFLAILNDTDNAGSRADRAPPPMCWC